MNIIAVIIMVAVVVGFSVALKLLQGRFGERTDYESRGILLNPAERTFLGVLEQALDSRYRVFGKVCLGDLIKPVSGFDVAQWTITQNRINRRHVDFVICTANELALVGVVMLNEQSNAHGGHAGRDRFVDQVLAIAGIPALCFMSQKEYAVQDVRVRLAEMIFGRTNSTVVSAVQKVITPVGPALDVIMESNPVQPDSVAPDCPKCLSVMVKRHTVRGRYSGRYFWACSAFPKCSQVMEIGEG